MPSNAIDLLKRLISLNLDEELRAYVGKLIKSASSNPVDDIPNAHYPNKIDGGKKIHTHQTPQQKPSSEKDKFDIVLDELLVKRNYGRLAPRVDEVGNMLLMLLATLVIAKRPQLKFIGTGKKSWASAKKKYVDNQGGVAASDLKDVCRGTILCFNDKVYQTLLAGVQTELRHNCWKSGGKETTLVDKMHYPAKSDNDIGYSDLNMTLTLPDGMKMECQANVQSILYGKMGKEEFITAACASENHESEYATLKRQYLVPGGCGHVLYEMHTEATTQASKDKIRDLSRRYYDILRRQAASEGPDFTKVLLDFAKASDDWKHVYERTPAKDQPDFKPGDTRWSPE